MYQDVLNVPIDDVIIPRSLLAPPITPKETNVVSLRTTEILVPDVYIYPAVPLIVSDTSIALAILDDGVIYTGSHLVIFPYARDCTRLGTRDTDSISVGLLNEITSPPTPNPST